MQCIWGPRFPYKFRIIGPPVIPVIVELLDKLPSEDSGPQGSLSRAEGTKLSYVQSFREAEKALGFSEGR